MSLTFVAVIPNHPKLADSLALPKPESRTVEAIKELEGELYFMKPDTIVLLTSYGAQVPAAANINLANTLQGSHGTSFPTDVAFAAHLKEQLDVKQKDMPITIIAEPKIPDEVECSLRFLLNHLKDTKVVMISTACLTKEDHFRVGDFLRREALETNKRIAFIAAGHLSSVGSDPDKMHYQQSLDQMFLTFVREKQPEKLLNINEEVCNASGSDLLEPMSTLLGVIHKINVNPEIISYEQVYDQGQLVLNFILR
jgi:aromatic ring-opening dioxygenase LigB subunit